MKLSIIIPVYNEEKTIREILKRVAKAELPNGIKKEIIIIDDGSTDETASRVNYQISGNKIFKFFQHTSNKGKGAAIRSGLEYVSGDFIIVQDADLEYNPNDYMRLLQPILEKKVEIVYGNRFEDYPLRIWGKNKTILPLNWIGNKILVEITNLLYRSNLEDMETCYKLFTKKVLDSLDLKAKRFEFEPEITAKVLKKGYKIYQVPIHIKPRTYKEGKKIGWIDGLVAVWILLKYRVTD